MALQLPPGNADPRVTILKTPSTSTTMAPATPGPADRQYDLIVNVFVPVIVVISTIMVAMGAAWCFHLWRKRRGRSNIETKHYYQSHNALDDTRNSVGTQASNNNNRKSSTPKEYIPSLDRISESPEDRLRTRRNPYSTVSEESILSVLSKLHFDVKEAAANSHYIPAHEAANTSQSYPNLREVHPQPPYSPYHLTWVSPANRHIHSEPNMATRPMHQRRIPNRECTNMPSSLCQSWRSPYHPSYNTPTETMDVNGNIAFPSNVIINRMPPTELPHIRTIVSSADFRKRRSEPIFLTGEKVKKQSRDELILSASKLNLESRRHEPIFPASVSGSTNTSSVCAVCSNTYTQKIPQTCECCSSCHCQPQPTIPSSESLTGNVGSAETSIQQRRSQELSFQNAVNDPLCHGSCDTTHSGPGSSSSQSQNNSGSYSMGPSHSTSQNTSQAVFGVSCPTSALPSRSASPTLIHDDTVCSAPAAVLHSTGNKEKLASSGPQTVVPYDISSVSYVAGPPPYQPPPYQLQCCAERISHQAVFEPCGAIQQVSQESMANLSTDVHRSMSNVPGRESSYEWDAYPFYPHQLSSQNSGINSSQNSSIISRPLYPILSEEQYWV